MIEKYLSQGYHCIPCLKSSKASALEKGYSTIDYGEKGITEEQAVFWDEKFPIKEGYGLGLLCGDASRTIAIDIDSNDADLARLLPESPAVKKGETGETRFFQKPSFLSRTIVIKPEVVLPRGAKDQVEFLSNGKYTLLPPSIHERTKTPYIWIGEDQLIYLTPDELPTLDESVLEAVRDFYARKYGYSKEKKKSIDLSGYHPPEKDRVAHGSHDRVKQLTATLIGKELPVEVAVKEIIDYDREHHGPLNYFKDKSRGVDAAADEETNALRFYTNLLFTINKERAKKNETPHKFLYAFNEVTPSKPIIAERRRAYPKARGFMGDFQKWCDLNATCNVDGISLGGALSVMSVLSANRFRTQAVHYDVRSNLYVVNLAKSGVGKEVPQNLAKSLLKDTVLLGPNTFRSGTSIVQSLPERQESLSIMNECASFLKDVAQGEGYQQEMNDILSNLFSCSNSFFSGISFAEKGDKFGACNNPSLSIFGSTTVDGFRGAVNKSMGVKGLMPRFLTFWQFSFGDRRWPTLEDQMKSADILKDLKNFVSKMLSTEKRLAQGFKEKKETMPILENGKVSEPRSMGNEYDPVLIPMTQKATKLYKAFAEKQFPKETDDDSFEEAFKNRFAEIATKCALLDALSLGLDEIDEDSMGWGIDVVEACWTNVRPIYQHTSAENSLEQNALRVLELIRNSPNGVAQNDLTRKTQWVTKKQRQEILADLEEAAWITKEFRKAANNKVQAFYSPA